VPADRDALLEAVADARARLAAAQRAGREREALLGMGYAGASGAAVDDLAALRRKLGRCRAEKRKAEARAAHQIFNPVCDRLDAFFSAVLRELAESNQFVQTSAESPSIWPSERFRKFGPELAG
jgi:hypothetical protein